MVLGITNAEMVVGGGGGYMVFATFDTDLKSAKIQNSGKAEVFIQTSWRQLWFYLRV